MEHILLILCLGMEKKSLVIILLTAVLSAFAFQNCSPISEQTFSSDESKIVDLTSNYQQLSHTNAPDFQLKGSNNSVLNIDFDNQTLTIDGQNISNCSLDSETLNNLYEIIGDGKICQPTLPADAAVCLAIGTHRTSMVGDNGTVEFRSMVCGSGTYLCNGNLGKLQSYLDELIKSPPSHCL